MSGFVDVVLGVPHHAQHPRDDPQRKNRLQPKELRHRQREEEEEEEEGIGILR